MIALVDCNNFFASCERLFRPDLKDRPVLVLSNNDGCVVARSNEVKALGVPMGVPYFKVRDIVEQNHVTCFSSNFALYSNISQRILAVLTRYAPELEVYSIDEAFLNLDTLNITNYTTWGNELREEVWREVGMPVSIGIAPTKTLAKLASGYAKKHDQSCVLDPAKSTDYYQTVLEAVPVTDVWGIGRKLASRMNRAGIHTTWQLANTSQAWLKTQLGITGVRMHRELSGTVAYAFEDEKTPQKSLLASRSFGHTVKNLYELETAVASFASQAAYRLRSHDQTTSQFGLYLRFRQPDGAIRGQSASTKFLSPTNDTSDLVGVALQLLMQLYNPENGYKKAGVFAGRLQSAAVCQLSFFDGKTPKETARRQQFMYAIDSINHRYGSETIHVGAVDPKARRWHAKKERISPAYTTNWLQLPRVYPSRDGLLR